MKRLLFLCFLACFIAVSGSVWARAETPLKIGVFDLQRIMQESKAIKDYRQKLLADMETKRKPLREKEESTKALQEELKKEGPKMSASRRRSQEEKLAAELKELRRLKEDIDTEIAKMERELTQQALRDIEKVIKKIAKKEDYAIVFEKNAAGIVYFKDSVDITESIIADYDKR